jgi:hypothetical protein
MESKGSLPGPQSSSHRHSWEPYAARTFDAARFPVGGGGTLALVACGSRWSVEQRRHARIDYQRTTAEAGAISGSLEADSAVWRWKAAILFHISGALEYMGKWPLRVISASCTPLAARCGR